MLSPACAQTPQETVNLRYATIIHGYHAVDTTAAYAVRPWGYGATAHLTTVGMASWFLTIDLTSTAEGHFFNNEALPISYDSHGFSRGKNRHVHLAFDHNGPHITSLMPVDNDREPLSQRQLSSSKDILSALITLLHRLETEKNCDVSGTVFDGMRLMKIDAHGPRHDDIPEDHGSYYTGDALRCDFTGRQIGGFSQETSHKAEQASPHPGIAWFKTLEKGRIIPVRIEFQHPKLGRLLLVLQSAATITRDTDDNSAHP